MKPPVTAAAVKSSDCAVVKTRGSIGRSLCGTTCPSEAMPRAKNSPTGPMIRPLPAWKPAPALAGRLANGDGIETHRG
jgi:hypothetical protein